MTGNPFDLGALIRDVYDDSKNRDVAQLTAEVSKRIPTEHRKGVFTICLRAYVQADVNRYAWADGPEAGSQSSGHGQSSTHAATGGTSHENSETAEVTEGFDLRTLSNHVLADTTLASPRELAGEILARVPDKYLREALRESLRFYCREVVSNSRVFSTPGQVKVDSGRSTKVAGRREWWKQALQDRIHIGGNKWLNLADCTAQHLRAAAHCLREEAGKKIAKAERYELLAQVADDQGAEHVGDLSEDTVLAVLGGHT